MVCETPQIDAAVVAPEPVKPSLKFKLPLVNRAEADHCSLSQRSTADAMNSDDSSENNSPCAEGAAKMRYIQKLDPCRFTFQRKLPLARRPGTLIELYTDSSSGQTVAAKRFSREKSESRLLQAMWEGGPNGLEASWPEVVYTQRLGRARGDPASGACECYGAFLDGRGDVLLMTEFIPGGDLLDFASSLGQVGPEREKQVWPVIVSLLRAVYWMHARGVAHCDVSLENALRRPGPQGDVVLIDFETAVAGGRQLRTGICGKPSYQAPEMWSGRPWDTFAADFFACGVAAYSLAVGQYPWDSTKPGACERFAYFASRGFPDFLEAQRLGDKSLAECISPRLSMLLKLLLSRRPRIRETAATFVGLPSFGGQSAD